jgi:hypothetical protein
VALAFEQQPKESDKAFAAFSMYLSLGPQRSLSVTAEKLGKSKRMMEKWSKRFGWPTRVQAHGAHMALVEREAAEALARAKGVDWVKRQEEHREQEWRVRCELMEAAQGALKRLTKSDRCWSPEGIARLVELASELGRRACEMATEKAEVTGVVKVEVEIEAALKKVYGQAEPGPTVAVQPPREIREPHEQVVDVEAKQIDLSLVTSSPTEAPCGGPAT